MKLAERLSKIELSATIAGADRVRELEKRGEKIIRLETGEPHFDTPKNISSGAINALKNGKTHYSHSRGLIQLRQLICEKYNKKYGTKFDYEKQVIITPGAKQALLYLMFALVEEGDRVFIFSPGWASYAEMVKLAGGTPVFLEGREEDGFWAGLEAIKSSWTPKVKAIIINSPNNPTGKIIARVLLEKIYEFCLEKDMMLIVDEIYNKIIFSGHKSDSVAALASDLENCAIINGFSKTYAMAGWRLGYLFSCPEVINAAAKLQQSSATCPVTFAQYGAIEALKRGEEFIKSALRVYQRNRDMIITRFADSKMFRVVNPEGGLYVFINISRITNDSKAFCAELLNKDHISVTPGVAFGSGGEGYIRICLATNQGNIAEFLRRIKSRYENY